MRGSHYLFVGPHKTPDDGMYLTIRDVLEHCLRTVSLLHTKTTDTCLLFCKVLVGKKIFKNGLIYKKNEIIVM